MQNVNLLGEFPGWNTARILSVAAPRLEGRTSRWPLADASVEPFPVAMAAFRQLKSVGLLAAADRAQMSFSLGVEWFDEPLIPRLPAVPSDELAVQIVFPLSNLTAREREGVSRESLHASAVAALCRAADAVPADAEFVVHFCCLDGARYVMAPQDMMRMVELSNRLIAGAGRAVTSLHLPVPLRHTDDAFFRGLEDLDEDARARLCLGLVHLSDGVDGALRRAAMAERFVPNFAIAARSGFAARADDDIAGFLDLHAEVAARLEQEV